MNSVFSIQLFSVSLYTQIGTLNKLLVPIILHVSVYMFKGHCCSQAVKTSSHWIKLAKDAILITRKVFAHALIMLQECHWGSTARKTPPGLSVNLCVMGFGGRVNLSGFFVSVHCWIYSTKELSPMSYNFLNQSVMFWKDNISSLNSELKLKEYSLFMGRRGGELEHFEVGSSILSLEKEGGASISSRM